MSTASEHAQDGRN